MTIIELGALGEFVGAILLFCSLLFVGFQIRQNTNATKAASRLGITRDYREVNSLQIQNPAAAEAFREGLQKYPEMEYEKRLLFNAVIGSEGIFFQGVWAQFDSGQLDTETYEAYLLWFSSIIATPGGKAWWDEVARSIYVSSQVVAVDNRVAHGDLPDILRMPAFSLRDDTA